MSWYFAIVNKKSREIFVFVVFSKSSDIPRVSFKLPDCSTGEKIEDCLISHGPPVNCLISTAYSM